MARTMRGGRVREGRIWKRDRGGEKDSQTDTAIERMRDRQRDG